MSIINQHDWSLLEEWFDKKAAAAGKDKGTLEYYAYAETISIEDEPLFKDIASEMAYNAAMEINKMIGNL